MDKLRRRKIFYGWWVLVACTGVVFFSASWVNYGFTVLFDPVQKELGWSTAMLAVAFSLRNFGGPIAGLLIDRFGPRKMITAGIIFTAIGSLLLSQIQSVWIFYAAFALVAMGNSFSNPMPGTVAVVRWFVRLRSRALTIFTVCNGFGGLSITFMGSMVDRFGWRLSLRLFAMMTSVVCLPVSFAIRDRPEHGVLPDGDVSAIPESTGCLEHGTEESIQHRQTSIAEGLTVSQALNSKSFWHLVGSVALSGLGTSPVTTLLVPSLLKENVPNSTILILAASLPLLSLPWRLALGWLGDYWDKRRLLGLCYGFSAVSLVCLANGSSLLWLVLFALTYSFGFGGPNPLRPALQADYFGTRSMGTIQGLTQVFTLVDAFVGPLLVGWVVDLTGSYRPAWLLLGLCAALATPLMLTMPPNNRAQDPRN